MCSIRSFFAIVANRKYFFFSPYLHLLFVVKCRWKEIQVNFWFAANAKQNNYRKLSELTKHEKDWTKKKTCWLFERRKKNCFLLASDRFGSNYIAFIFLHQQIKLTIYLIFLALPLLLLLFVFCIHSIEVCLWVCVCVCACGAKLPSNWTGKYRIFALPNRTYQTGNEFYCLRFSNSIVVDFRLAFRDWIWCSRFSTQLRWCISDNYSYVFFFLDFFMFQNSERSSHFANSQFGMQFGKLNSIEQTRQKHTHGREAVIRYNFPVAAQELMNCK